MLKNVEIQNKISQVEKTSQNLLSKKNYRLCGIVMANLPTPSKRDNYGPRIIRTSKEDLENGIQKSNPGIRIRRCH